MEDPSFVNLAPGERGRFLWFCARCRAQVHAVEFTPRPFHD